MVRLPRRFAPGPAPRASRVPWVRNDGVSLLFRSVIANVARQSVWVYGWVVRLPRCFASRNDGDIFDVLQMPTLEVYSRRKKRPPLRIAFFLNWEPGGVLLSQEGEGGLLLAAQQRNRLNGASSASARESTS